MEAKQKKNNNLPVLIICAVLFMICWFIQGKVQTMPNPPAVNAAEAMEGIIQEFNIPKDRVMNVMGPL